MKKLIGLMLLAWCGVAGAQVNGGAITPVDPGGGSSVFIGQSAGLGSFTNIPAMAKGFFVCIGFQTCGGQGTGMTNAGVNVENTAVGYLALAACTTCYYNTVLGVGSLRNDATANNNLVLGVDSLSGTTGATNNIALGNGVMRFGTGINNNIGFGAGSLGGQTSSTASQNIAIGYCAMCSTSMTTAANNVAIGVQALQNATTNSSNVAIGYAAGQNSTGNYNTFVGNGTAPQNSSGQFVTTIGMQVGGTCQTGQKNLLIGHDNTTVCPAANSSNLVNIDGLLYYNNNSLAAPAVSACGTSPGIDTHANNKSGTVTVGSGTVTSCTITFAGSGYSTWNHCRVTYQSAVVSPTYSYTKTVLTLGGTSLTSVLVDYDCDGY